jgi:hypothetical protein
LILTELEKARLALELLATPDGAEIVLRYRGEELRRPDYFQTLYGGRGEVRAVKDGRVATVVAFSGTRMRPFGDKPATKFAAAFVEAYRRGNR